MGPNSGAYSITLNDNYDSNESNEVKDIQDSTTQNETSTWPARWTSRNGTEFRKVTSSSWATITNDSELLAAWDASGTSETTIDIADGDLYVLDLGNEVTILGRKSYPKLKKCFIALKPMSEISPLSLKL